MSVHSIDNRPVYSESRLINASYQRNGINHRVWFLWNRFLETLGVTSSREAILIEQTKYYTLGELKSDIDNLSLLDLDALKALQERIKPYINCLDHYSVHLSLAEEAQVLQSYAKVKNEISNKSIEIIDSFNKFPVPSMDDINLQIVILPQEEKLNEVLEVPSAPVVVLMDRVIGGELPIDPSIKKKDYPSALPSSRREQKVEDIERLWRALNHPIHEKSRESSLSSPQAQGSAGDLYSVTLSSQERNSQAGSPPAPRERDPWLTVRQALENLNA